MTMKLRLYVGVFRFCNILLCNAICPVDSLIFDAVISWISRGLLLFMRPDQNEVFETYQ